MAEMLGCLHLVYSPARTRHHARHVTFELPLSPLGLYWTIPHSSNGVKGRCHVQAMPGSTCLWLHEACGPCPPSREGREDQEAGHGRLKANRCHAAWGGGIRHQRSASRMMRHSGDTLPTAPAPR